MPLLELKNVSVSYGNVQVLQGISFSLERGETVAVIGPNGSGKTTLFRAILGVVPFEGEIIWGEKVRIGYVPQKIDLERDLPLTVEEYLSLQPLPKETEVYTPSQVLEMVGLDSSFLEKRISRLSAGEFQRVLIAFSLIARPDLFLFDEPTASLDIGGEESLYELLHRLQRKENFSLILISHDLSIVYRYADKVLCLNRVQLCFGLPREVLTPQELERMYGGKRKFYQHIHP